MAGGLSSRACADGSCKNGGCEFEMTSRMALFVHRAILQTYKRLVVQQLVVAVTVLSCAQLDRAELLEHRKQAFPLTQTCTHANTHTHSTHTRSHVYACTYVRSSVYYSLTLDSL
jgi:hypothetical protein